ncbi:MAG: hypothetical protein HZA54_00735 [Planctomycetes bacterium]|nr:hypothetical protein [Planctomycetota bacterium]
MADTKKKSKDPAPRPPAAPDPLHAPLAAFRDPAADGWDHAWVGIEPTFQSEKSIKKWAKMAAEPGGEDAYFLDEHMLGIQKDVAQGIVEKYREKRKEGRPWCFFARVEREEELDQWKVRRQNLTFRWEDRALPDFELRFTLDPETWEYSIKPVPLPWFYDDRFVRFLDELVWEVPMKLGLSASIAHGGAQFSISAKTYLRGSLLADDIADKLNHPELSTWMMDWPNPDDRPFRATTRRAAAFRSLLDAYWAGGFHPRALGRLTTENAYLDRGFGPATNPPPGLMDAARGPIGDAETVFRTNFAFARAVRLAAQNVHPGYWQSQHPDEDGYRPDQIMRYSEGNLNRLQIAGELHVKSGKVLQAERVPELDAPLTRAGLTTEASWENRGQMGRTSARDFVEALLLDVHAARRLEAQPRVRVEGTLLADQLLGDAEATLRKHGGTARLDRLHEEARAANLAASHGRMKTEWIEPEVLFWETWRALPAGERAAVAREAVGRFVERVTAAAAHDPRRRGGGAASSEDPMEWHRHRVHPELWSALAARRGDLKAGDPARRELEAWEARRAEYLARRPVFSQAGLRPPWGGG